MAAAGDPGSLVTDPDLWKEQQRFYNFLQRYELHKYHPRFLRMGVSRVTHFKDVTDADLDAMGFTPPEKTRLRKKFDENFSKAGKIKKALAGKAKVFDGDPVPSSFLQLNESQPVVQQDTMVISREDVKIGEKLGEGAHGSVYEGTWSNKHGSVTVAVKTLFGKDEVHTTFVKEAESMTKLLHPHIIQLYGLSLSSPLMLVQELAPLGDLHTFLKKHGASKNLELFHTYAVQIADAMKYLEAKRIVHRDLATRNILLSAEDLLKLSDFGMARILDEQTGIYNLSNLQSRIPIAWTALEALMQAKFSSASDVWSYAVTLWEMYSLGETPWKGLNPIETRDYLVRGERLGCPERCPREIYHVMMSGWEMRPQDRPTFANIHETLVQKCKPMRLRATKAHSVADDIDNNCLSFQKGDILFLINKPKQGWLYGMLLNGKIGYFLEDHVTAMVNSIGEIKDKLQAGKAKVTQLPIGNPTDVSHELHWDKSGEKWGEIERELTSKQQFLSRSPLHSPPPFTVVNNSPVSKSTPQGGVASAVAAMATDVRYSTPSVSSASTNGSGGEVSPGHNNASTSRDPTTITTEDDDMVINDQYVTMRRGATLATGREVLEEDKDDYIDMKPSLRPDPKRASMYENVGQDDADVNFYSTPRSNTIHSSGSGSSQDSVARAGLQQPLLPPRGVKENTISEATATKKNLTLSAAASQYSTQASHDLLADTPTGALSPTGVKFLQPTAMPPATSNGHRAYDTREEEHLNEEDKDEVILQSPTKPKPKPRKGEVKRSSSMASPDITPNLGRKLSLPVIEQDLIDLNDDLADISLDKNHPKILADPGEDLEPLISLSNNDKPPPVPDRTYLSPAHSSGSDTSVGGTGGKLRLLPPAGNPLAEEFPDADESCIHRALESHGSDIEKAREEVQVQILLGMSVPNTNAEDCRRALKHCQGKIDRAAIWLVERGLELDERRT